MPKIRDFGGRGSARSDLPLSAKAQRDVGAVSTELSVLRTTLRRLGYVGLQVFDVWAETASEGELEWANDNVKPLLDQLCHLKTDGAGSE